MVMIIKSTFGRTTVLILTCVVYWGGLNFFDHIPTIATIPTEKQWWFIALTYLFFGWGALMSFGLSFVNNGYLKPLTLDWKKLNLLGCSVLIPVTIMPTCAVLFGLLGLLKDTFMGGVLAGAAMAPVLGFVFLFFCLMAEEES
jgi:hypothetical protein